MGHGGTELAEWFEREFRLLHPGKASYRLPMTSDDYFLTGFHPVQDFAQVSFGFCQADGIHVHLWSIF
jgi:hypothetical protein